jgi:hypothetical protein
MRSVLLLEAIFLVFQIAFAGYQEFVPELAQLIFLVFLFGELLGT